MACLWLAVAGMQEGGQGQHLWSHLYYPTHFSSVSDIPGHSSPQSPDDRESGLVPWSNQALSCGAVFPTSLLWQQKAAAVPQSLTPGLHSHCI